MKRELSIGAVIYTNTQQFRFLLLEYKAGHIGYVKGGIKEGETQQETLLREVKEETRIAKLNILPGFKSIVKYTYNLNGENIFKRVIFYLAQTPNKKVTLSSEHKDYFWLPYNQAHNKLSFPEQKELLEKAYKHLKEEKL